MTRTFSLLSQILNSPPPPPACLRQIPVSRLRLLIVVLALVLAAAPAYAATINIDTDCQLDEAVTNANDDAQTNSDCEAGSGADTIVIPSGHGTITVNYLPRITTTITINGNGNTLTSNASAIISIVEYRASLTINNLTVQGSTCNTQGCAFAVDSGGSLTINNSRFYNNAVVGGSGGAIDSAGALVINNSVFSGNSASSNGGAIEINGGNATIRNTTFTGNSSDQTGMAISLTRGNLTLEYVSIVNNSASVSNANTAGLYRFNGNLTLRNSILSGNTLANGAARDCYGSFSTASDNLINDADSTCSSAASITSDPDLGALSNGVFPLNSSSPAISAASCLAGVSVDQRGESRETSGDTCDMGAWEGQPPDSPGAPVLIGGVNRLGVTVNPPDSGDFNISDYQYRLSADDSDWGGAVSAGSDSGFWISGLTGGITWHVQVRAASAAGPGAWSASASAHVIAPTATPTATPTPLPDPPSRPDAPKLTPWDERIDGEISPPADDGGSPIIGYRYRWSADGTNWSSLGTPANEFTIYGLSNDTMYYVQARAQNAFGSSPWSESATATPRDATAPDTPAAPALTASVDTATNEGFIGGVITPPNNNYSPIYGYRYRWSTDGFTWTTKDRHIAQFIISGLQVGTTYTVQVQARNGAGDSAWSDSASITPLPLSKPRDPDATATMQPIGRATATATYAPIAYPPDAPIAPHLTAGDRRIDGVITPPNDNGSWIYNYGYRYSTDERNWRGQLVDVPWFTITGLDNGETYYVQVIAVSDVGESPFSPSARITLPRTDSVSQPAQPSATPRMVIATPNLAPPTLTEAPLRIQPVYTPTPSPEPAKRK